MIAAGWIELALLVVTIGGLIGVHVAPTGLSPLRDPVRQYHLTRWRPLIAISTIASGLAAIAAIVAFVALVGSAATVTAVLLAIYAIARIVIPFVRMDPPDHPVSTRGHVHTWLAFAAFGAATAAAFVAGGAIHDAGFADAATLVTIAGVIAAIGSVGLLVTVVSRKRALFGLFERVIYVGNLGFLVVLGVLAVTAHTLSAG